MLDILHGQEFKRGIPAGLPDDARVAHKTGEISTVAHDAGIVYLPDREPYVVVILTEWDASKGGRQETIAKISRVVFQHVTEGDDASE
jgi:beta-lactamase class A